ncbi:MAG: RraA family protein [Defluviitaleaceae bacterium]|nr:RraA family protein [Defluviitaleaceae bacterium]
MNRQEILEMYKDFRVTDVRDGLDWCGYHHYGTVHHSIKPLWRTRAIGFARTARYLPYEGPVPQVTGDEYTKWVSWYYGNVCTDKWGEDIIPGDFICLDICGLDVGLLGSCNTLDCVNKGAVGFLLNGGGVRDTDEVILQKIPVFTKHVSQPMDQARIRYYEKNIPIAIGGVAIYPDDLVVADGDGVVVVPNKLIYDVYKYAYQEMKGDKIARRGLYIQGGRTPDETVEISNLN